MRNSFLSLSHLSLALSLASLAGCSSIGSHASRKSPDRAYIIYWPPTKGEGRLRLAVKDLIDMKGVVTTAGAEHFAKNNPPAVRDAKCLAIARERGVRIVGKTNLTELALGVSGNNRYFGAPKNIRRDKERDIAGGSSSGSAVAVANGSADVSFGTDTAGSIRVPAACCGIYGLKTTFGLIPTQGVYPISAKHLDTVGPMAKTLPRLVDGMDLLQPGFGQKYDAATASQKSPRRVTIGRLYIDGTDAKIDKAVDDALKAKGFNLVVLNKAFQAEWKQAEEDGKTVAVADAWLTNQHLAGVWGISAGTKAVFALGAVEHAINYTGALKRQAAWQRTLRRTFQHVDFIALPTLKSLPPAQPRFFGGTPALEAFTLSLQNTVAVNYAGNPALALPLPVAGEPARVTSLQLIGPRLSEAKLLSVGRFFETRPL